MSPTVLLRQDGQLAYPVHGDVPVLMIPEALVPLEGSSDPFPVWDRRYAEAYLEREFYNSEAIRVEVDRERGEAFRRLESVDDADRRTFPDPVDFWVDAFFDSLAQEKAYRALQPSKGGMYLQLGGKGQAAATFLTVGADHVFTCSPMLAEQEYAIRLARSLGMNGRLDPVMAIAEELPFADGTFDGIYSGGSLHHMQTDLAFPEISRVLKPGAVFAAVEPWRAPGYGVGTAILGQRESGAACSPLTQARVGVGSQHFSRFEIHHHGSLTRYPMLAMSKAGFVPRHATLRRITLRDDQISSRIGIRRYGSSVAVIGWKR